MSIGENIRKLREEQGLNQKDLAQRVEIAPAMLCQIERGTKSVTLPLARDIAKALDCSIDSLVEE